MRLLDVAGVLRNGRNEPGDALLTADDDELELPQMVVGRSLECRADHPSELFVAHLFAGEVADGAPVLQYAIEFHIRKFDRLNAAKLRLEIVAYLSYRQK